DSLCKEIFKFPYPQTFTKLEAPVSKRRVELLLPSGHGGSHFSPKFRAPQLDFARLDRFNTPLGDHLDDLAIITAQNPSDYLARLEFVLIDSGFDYIQQNKDEIIQRSIAQRDISGLVVLSWSGVSLLGVDLSPFGVSSEALYKLICDRGYKKTDTWLL